MFVYKVKEVGYVDLKGYKTKRSRIMKHYLCSHATERCRECDHNQPHEPFEVNSWPECCHEKRGYCDTAQAVVICHIHGVRVGG